MKNYHLTYRVLFTVFKWITLDITLRPKYDTLFIFSIDRKVNCSLPGVYVNFSFLKLFNLWFSIHDERLWDEKNKTLVGPRLVKSQALSAEQISCADGLLGDLIRIAPRVDQMFHNYDNLPDQALAYKQQFTDLSHEMESYLRTAITQNR
jgi:hypothetical protein